VKRCGAMVVALAATAAVMAPSASATVKAAKQKEVSVEKYAKTLCSAYNQVIEDTTDFADSVSELEITDPAAYQAAVVAQGRALVAKYEAAENRLKRVRPDVDDGRTVSKLFASNAIELQTLLGDALDTFEAADPDGVAFVADVSVFEVALSTMSLQLTDVTTDITDQDLIGAIGDEKECHEIFPVTGG
jgi:hypothetical protein